MQPLSFWHSLPQYVASWHCAQRLFAPSAEQFQHLVDHLDLLIGLGTEALGCLHLRVELLLWEAEATLTHELVCCHKLLIEHLAVWPSHKLVWQARHWIPVEL